MSDHIPFEIQTEIIKNLPVISLIRFRSVSKSWKSLIDSSEFIVNYHVNCSQLQHNLLVRYIDAQELYEWNLEDENYLSIVDDVTFPQNWFPLIVPTSVKKLGRLPLMLGTSQGLFSFYNTPVGSNRHKEMTVVIWNPTIDKSVSVVVPNVFRNYPLDTVVGFGVCPRTMDPMLVKITYSSSCLYNMIMCIPFQVEIFTLSSGVWRSSSNNMPRKSLTLSRDQASLDRFIYWLATDRIRKTEGDGYDLNNIILSFHMISEEFADIYLPDSLARLGNCSLTISELKTSLVVLEINMVGEKREYCVWKMDHGVPNSFKKLFVFKAPETSPLNIHMVIGFRKTGEPMIDMLYDTDERNALVVYDPDSDRINYIGIYGVGFPYLATSYMETLLLHNY
ncbi:putative F-box protein At1g47790 [Rutidosis leptorrhynchoides]|uniref:putative F-box protein At1g47790 n=1 Tax=Rutidosis leptorrhynchoides TaxID=125765 RepID=UPI003A991BA1